MQLETVLSNKTISLLRIWTLYWAFDLPSYLQGNMEVQDSILCSKICNVNLLFHPWRMTTCSSVVVNSNLRCSDFWILNWLLGKCLKLILKPSSWQLPQITSIHPLYVYIYIDPFERLYSMYTDIQISSTFSVTQSIIIPQLACRRRNERWWLLWQPRQAQENQGGARFLWISMASLNLSVWECWRLKVRHLPGFFWGKIISLVLVPLYHIWLSHLFTSCYIVALCHIFYWLSLTSVTIRIIIFSHYCILVTYHSVPISAQKRRWLRFWVHSPRSSLAAPDVGVRGVGRAGPGVSHRENRWRESRNNLRRLMKRSETWNIWNTVKWFKKLCQAILGMEMKVLSHDNDCAQRARIRRITLQKKCSFDLKPNAWDVEYWLNLMEQQIHVKKPHQLSKTKTKSQHKNVPKSRN